MRWIIVVLIAHISFATGAAQQFPESDPLEIFIEQIHVDSTTTIEHTITAQGAYWDDLKSVSSSGDLGQSSVEIQGSNQGIQNYGWDWQNTSGGTLPDFGFALYRLTNDYSETYFQQSGRSPGDFHAPRNPAA